MNDIVVLFLSEFMFCFTDLTRSEEDRYLIGWVYLVIFAYLVGSNILVMFFLAVRDALKTLKRKIFICRRERILKRIKEVKKQREIGDRQTKAYSKALKSSNNKIYLEEARIDRELQQQQAQEILKLMQLREKQLQAIVWQRLDKI